MSKGRAGRPGIYQGCSEHRAGVWQGLRLGRCLQAFCLRGREMMGEEAFLAEDGKGVESIWCDS